MLRVGASEVNITPEPGLPMSGMIKPPKAEGVKWPLMGRTIVFDDGVNRAALVCLDLLVLNPVTVAELRTALTIGTELAPTDVMITCNHTHRGPYTSALMDEDPDFAYIDFLRQQLTESMGQALANRQPATLKVSSIMAPGWTFNRRQIYRTDMGEQVGTQGPEWIDEFVRREGPEDDELSVLIAESENGEVIAGLVNFACHTTVMGSEPVYSADFSGPLTEALMEQHGGVFAFLQGTSGNLWSIDRSVDRPFKEMAGPEYAVKMARGLADKANEALSTAQTVEKPSVQTARTVLHIPQRRPTREQVALAKRYLEVGDLEDEEFQRRIYGHPFTFQSSGPQVQEWFARETIGMWEWQRRVGTRELLEDVEVQVIAVGDVAFVGYPGEVFSEFGLQTKQGSPFAKTFVAELANGWHGYIPTEDAFQHGGFETRLGYQSRLVPEAGGHMTDTGVRLLNELHND